MAKTSHPPVGINLNAIHEGFDIPTNLEDTNIDYTPRLHPIDQVGMRRNESEHTFLCRLLIENFEDPEQEWLINFFTSDRSLQEFIRLYWLIPFYHSNFESRYYYVWGSGFIAHLRTIVEVLKQFPLKTAATHYRFLYLTEDKGLLNNYGLLDTYCRKLKSSLSSSLGFEASPHSYAVVTPSGEIISPVELEKNRPKETGPILLCHLLGVEDGSRMRFLFEERGYKKLPDGSPDISEIPKFLHAPERSAMIDFLVTVASGRYNDYLTNKYRKQLLIHMGKSNISVSHMESIKEFMELAITRNYPTWPFGYSPDKLPIFKNESIMTKALRDFKG